MATSSFPHDAFRIIELTFSIAILTFNIAIASAMPIYQDKLTKQPEYRAWFISPEGPHGKWATMSVLDKRNMTQKDYDMTLFVNNNSSTGGRVFLGMFWDEALCQTWLKLNELPEDQVYHYKGMRGLLRPRHPGEIVPPGVVELYTDDNEQVQKSRIADRSSRNMIAGAFDRNAENLMRNVRARVDPAASSWTTDDKNQLTPTVRSKEEKEAKETQMKAEAKAKAKAKRAAEDSDDEWFSTAPTYSRRPSNHTCHSGGGAGGGGGGGGGIVKIPKVGVTQGAIGWRAKANMERKIAIVDSQVILPIHLPTPGSDLIGQPPSLHQRIRSPIPEA